MNDFSLKNETTSELLRWLERQTNLSPQAQNAYVGELENRFKEQTQLLLDLHQSLFDFRPKSIHIPCDCPPGKPIYDSKNKLVDVEPSFSCVYCRLSRFSDNYYLSEGGKENASSN